MAPGQRVRGQPPARRCISLRVGLIAAQAYQAETTADFDYFTIEPLP